jgi:predicted hydrocarbon binding protein
MSEAALIEPSAPGAADSGEFHYPNKMGRIILLSVEEVMGRNGLSAVLHLAGLPQLINNYPPNNFETEFSFDKVSAIQQALDDLYGPRGGRALALRAGRATFKYGLKEFGPVLGIADLAFRLFPLSMKLKIGSEIFAETFNKFSDQRVRLEEDEGALHWIIERCPVCWQRKTQAPCCHLAVGLLQESLFWVSGGRNFAVVETECIASGAPECRIVIDKRPLD